MATTPNFNWSTPDNTGLVKNGALDIRTLGNSIDASMAQLKGGTTGQVLSKTSATDMAFTWTTPSSGSSNVAGKNGVLNSNFSIWQRGTSVSGAGGGAYTADRWFLYAGGQGTVSRQATGDTTNLPFIQYCARVQRTLASADTTVIPFSQSFETTNSVAFAGKTVTLSFYARKGANYSPTSSALAVVLATGTGTDQNYSSAGYTGSATPISQTATLTTTWQRFTYSATLSSSLTELAVQFTMTPTGIAGAADYYEVTGVQIEIGSSASAYSPNAGTIQGELAACQRYYYRITNPNSSSDAMMPTGFAIATTQANMWFNAAVSMRVTPTSVESANIRFFDGVSAFTPTISLSAGSEKIFGIAGTTTGLTQFRPYYAIAATGVNASYIGWSAEL